MNTQVKLFMSTHSGLSVENQKKTALIRFDRLPDYENRVLGIKQFLTKLDKVEPDSKAVESEQKENLTKETLHKNITSIE